MKNRRLFAATDQKVFYHVRGFQNHNGEAQKWRGAEEVSRDDYRSGCERVDSEWTLLQAQLRRVRNQGQIRVQDQGNQIRFEYNYFVNIFWYSF